MHIILYAPILVHIGLYAPILVHIGLYAPILVHITLSRVPSHVQSSSAHVYTYVTSLNSSARA